MAVVQDNKSTRIIFITHTGTNITAHTFCRRIRVQENYTSAAGATSDLTQKAPVGGEAVIILKGTPAVFHGCGRAERLFQSRRNSGRCCVRCCGTY